jgi:hypothetical protein
MLMLARPSAFAALLVAAGLLLPAAPVCAQSLKDLLGRPNAGGRAQAYPVVGRYVAAQGDSFVLDRTNGGALLKFDNEIEVWALTAHPGPRGDVIYRNDVGEAMVRATRLGGLILFTPERPAGTPVAFAARTETLRGRAMSPAQLFRQLAQASVRASRGTKRVLAFEAPDVRPGAEAVFAEAATVAADGVVRAASTSKGRSVLSRLRRVRFTEGPAAAVNVVRDTLEVVIAPAKGAAGRPSSKRTALAVDLAAPR